MNPIDTDLMQKCLSAVGELKKPDGETLTDEAAIAMLAATLYKEAYRTKNNAQPTPEPIKHTHDLSPRERLALNLGAGFLEYSDHEIDKILQLRDELAKNPTRPTTSPKARSSRVVRLRAITADRDEDNCYICGLKGYHGNTCVYHHRNYDAWGSETLATMVWLCFRCHAAVHKTELRQ